jgi:hypothetical protein
MSEPTPQLPPPPNPALLPVLATVVYLATVAAFWGILSLVLDRDVVDYPDAGPLLGPAMALAAGVITWLVLRRTRRSRSPWVGAVLALFGSLAAALVVAAVGYAPVAAAHFALSPFILGAAALSGLTVVATWALRPRRNI